VLRAPGDRADAAVFVEEALAAGDALFRPGGPFFEDADEGRVKPRVDRFVIPFGDRLDPGAAAERQDDVVPLYRLASDCRAVE
jgi:hypothetical protein